LREFKNNEAYYAGKLTVTGMTIGGISRNLGDRFPVLREALRARNRHHNDLPWLIYVMYLQLIIYWTLGKIFGKNSANFMADCFRGFFGKKKVWLTIR